MYLIFCKSNVFQSNFQIFCSGAAIFPTKSSKFANMKTVSLIEKVKQSLLAAGLSPEDNPRLLVAVSGGADSVCLLRVLLELGYNCVVAHCNFHLRGEESNRDEQFVRRLCLQLGVELHVRDFDVKAYELKYGVSTEMACRELRYAWFAMLRRELHCPCMAVAHHADDQVETFFINLMRGTGIRGLDGMESYKRGIARPMLDITREQVLQYLEDIGQEYVTDSTNLANDYRRNCLRNVVLPVLEEQFPGAKLRVRDTMSHLADERQLLDYLLRRYEEGVLEYDEVSDNSRIWKEKLLKAPQPGMMLYAMIGYMGFNRAQCDQAVKAAVGAKFYACSKTLTIERDFIVISAVGDKTNEEYLIHWNGLEDLPVALELRTDNLPFTPSMVDGKNVVAFNRDLMKCCQFVLRHWRRGDRFKPFGMKGSKLLSDLFVDLKLTQAQKSAVWLLEADGKILWALGYRAAHEFVVTPGATDYVLLRFGSN